MDSSERGHRNVAHTADLRVEAWAPTREQCVAEAVGGVVDSFVDIRAAHADGSQRCLIPDTTDEDLLVRVLDEVIYLLDTTGRIPVDVELDPVDGETEVRFATADAAGLPQVGAVPKAVALHELRFGPGPRGWSCSVILDV